MTDALILLLFANGMPVLVRRLLTHHLGYPIDGRRVAPDGNPWLGSSKTVVGVVSAVIATSVAAQILGRGWVLGAGFAALAMAGDLATSFVKRRLGLPRSSHRPGLDQLPESLLPLGVYAGALGLQWFQVLILAAVFLVIDLLLTPTYSKQQQHSD